MLDGLRLNRVVAAFVAVAFFAVSLLSANEIHVMVPAYANPCCDGGINMWQTLIATSVDPNRNFELHVIFNPQSGPGTTREPNYLDQAGNGPLASVRDGGAFIHGYVPTGFGTRDINAVKFDIDQYLINAAMYQGFIDGIFFDEMSNDLADVGYYIELRNYVQQQMPGAWTIGNPGTTFTNNPSGQTTYRTNHYVDTFDSLMTFENTGDEYQNNYTPPTFLNDLPPSGFVHMIHTSATWDSSLLTLAAQRKAGFLYVTDDVFSMGAANPWDTLTSFWSDFEQDLSQFNTAPVELAANSFSTFRGILVGGSLVDIQISDDARLRHHPGFTLNANEAPVWVVFDGVLLAADPCWLDFSIESQASTPGLTLIVELWNWNDHCYDLLAVESASFNSDSVVNVEPTNDIAEYVETGTLATRARVGWFRTGFTIVFPWQVRVDYVHWTTR